MAYKPKRSGKKDGVPNARSRRAASRTARGVTRPFESAGAEKSAPAKIGTRSLHEDEVNEAIKPVLSEFSLVLERIKISGPAANRTVEITVDYTEDRTDSLSLDSLAEISGALWIKLISTMSSSPTCWKFPLPELPENSPSAVIGNVLAPDLWR